MEELLKEANDGLFVRVYGIESMKLDAIEESTLTNLGHTEDKLKLIKVIALGYGITSDSCMKVDPFYFVVSGTGKPAECNGGAFPKEVKVWVMKKDTISVRLDPTTGTVEKLLEDYGPIDIKVKPSLSIKIKQRGDTKICLEYSYAIKAYYRVFGSGWNKFLSISDSGSECLGIDNCVEIIDNNFVTGKLCYYPNENKVCLKLKVGYKGVRVKVTECVNI